jgi:hypothetical protein
MGIVITHPVSCNISMTQASHTPLATPVSALSDAFCRLLVQQYRFNLLDYAVFQDRGMRVAPRDAAAFDPEKSDVNFFRLGMAAMNGDAKLVGEGPPMSCLCRVLCSFSAPPSFAAGPVPCVNEMVGVFPIADPAVYCCVQVVSLLREGTSVMRSDYDKRYASTHPPRTHTDLRNSSEPYE